jgi:hypothetical protein
MSAPDPQAPHPLTALPTAEQVYDRIHATADLVTLEDIRTVLAAVAALVREDTGR